MSSLSPVSEALTAMANWMMAIAACAGAIAAFIGLNTWKQQAKWQSNHELSKALLVGIRKRQDAVKHIRNPFGWSSEEELDDDVPKDEVRWRGIQKKLQTRFEELNKVRQEAYPQLLEANAIWRDQFTMLERAVANLEHELLIEIQAYIDSYSPRNSSGNYFGSQEERNSNHRVVYGSGGAKDVFGNKYNKAWNELESYLLGKFHG